MSHMPSFILRLFQLFTIGSQNYFKYMYKNIASFLFGLLVLGLSDSLLSPVISS